MVSRQSGKASDLAFILFTGQGDETRISRISNGRWATSAIGTASAAALSANDTVYSVTPLYHPSGLMMSIGGAIVGGSRLAMAAEFEPTMFWDEVRRYGVTVASYTWTLLHELVAAAPNPGERHHPVRLFIGSGMPRGLWRRVQRRFAPARVVEFYASAETGAILINLRDAKPGAMGRPLPGSPEVRLAAYDIEAGELVLGADGFVAECGPDEVGMLLARSREASGTATLSLRGVFQRDDAWLATGDLFRRDSDGDFWRLDSVRELIHSASGPVFTAPIRDALGDLPAVDIAVAYGVAGTQGSRSRGRGRDAAARVPARRGRVDGGPGRSPASPAPDGCARGGRDPRHHLVSTDHRAAARGGNPRPGRRARRLASRPSRRRLQALDRGRPQAPRLALYAGLAVAGPDRGRPDEVVVSPNVHAPRQLVGASKR